MSQFYWQLQTDTQQQEKNNAKDGNEWKCVGLTNDNTCEGLQHQQQQQQQQSYWWYQQNQTGTDPYSAAAFEGFRASSGNVAPLKNWQTSITPNIPSTFSAQQQQERIPEEKTVSYEVHEQENEQVQYSFGVHQTILDSERSFPGHNIEDRKVSGGKYDVQHVQVELVSADDAQGNVATGALLPEEEHVTESNLPVVAVAQVTPMIATAITTATETSFSAGVLSCNQTFPAAVPSANVARVGPISNHDSLGFSVNRVVPTLQSVIPNLQMPPLEPVAISARDAPILLTEETGEVQNTAAIEGTQAASNFVSLANSQQPDAGEVSVKGQDLDRNSTSNRLREVLNEDVNSLSTDDVQEARGQNELRQILKKDDKERGTAMSTSAEQSTDSTMAEDSLSRPNEKHMDSKNIRDRYRIIRQQYPEVIKRLDRLRMEAHNLDCRSMQKAPLVEVDEILIGLNHSYTFPDHRSSEDSSTKNDVSYGEDFVNSLRRNRHARTREHDFLSRGTKSEMGEIGPYRGPAFAKHRHMMQHAYGYHSSAGYQSYEYYPSGRQSLGPHLGRHAAHELAMMHNDGNVPARRPQSSFDAPYSKYQQFNEFAQDFRRNGGGEHSFESGEESSGSDSEIARIHNGQKMAQRTATTRHNAMPFTAPNEFYYFGVIQLPQERVEYIMRRLPPPPEYFQTACNRKGGLLVLLCSLSSSLSSGGSVS
uniref:Protein transport protein sec16 n=1 Tax=Loa loa TaxID=7209 RepID=A0A1I7VJR1_LOALO